MALRNISNIQQQLELATKQANIKPTYMYTLNQNLKCFQKSFRYNLDLFKIRKTISYL